MPILLNGEGAAEDLAPEHADAALAAGTHSIPLVSPEGDPVSAPLPERDSLLQQGYKLPSQEQLQSLVDASKYGTTGQAIGAGVEGALETASLGTSGVVESAIGKAAGIDNLSAEAQRKRQEQNPIAHPVGEAIGAIAPALLGDELGIPSLLGKVGEVAEVGAKALVGGAPERLATKLAGWAGRGAAESAALTGEHVLNESLLGDPKATAEHALSEVGLSALFGGTGGAILGKAAETTGNLASKLLGRGEEGGLLSNLTKLKPNADEITSAADRLGVDLLPGQLSASKTVQDLQSQIAKEPTIVGRKEQAAIDSQFDAIRQATADALGSSTPMTKAEVGQVLAAGIKNRVEEEYRPIREAYEFLASRNVNIPLAKEDLTEFQSGIQKIEGAHKRPGSPEGSFTSRVANQLPLQETVADLRQLRTSAGKEGFSHTRPELWHYAGRINDKLDELEGRSISNSVVSGLKTGAITSEEASHLVATMDSTKEAYKNFIGDVKTLGKALGKGKINGVEHFLSFIEDGVSGEQLAQKLFVKENSRFLKFFQEKFPEQARVVSEYQKSVIAEKAFKDGIVQPGVAMREVDKLEPEARRFLFSKDDLGKLDDARTLLEAMPRDINPSGTAKSLSWTDALNPSRSIGGGTVGGAIGGVPGAIAGATVGLASSEASTLLKRSLMRGLVSGSPAEAARHQTLGRLMDLSQKGAASVTTAAKAIFAKNAAERLTLGKDERERLADRLDKMEQDPELLSARINKMTSGVGDHAPDTAVALSSTATKAAAYLSSLRPKAQKFSPFGPEVAPSDFQRAAFKRAAEAVLDPVGVMHRVIDGTVSMADVQALQTVYPELYSGMRQAVATEMAQAVKKGTQVPYSTRLGASLFLGMPVDPSMSPASILSAQGAFATASARPDPNAKGPAPAKHSTSALSKVGSSYQTPEQAAEARRSKSS